MKKLAFALVILALIVTFSPAAAESPREPVGERIDFNAPIDTFSAGVPFHIMHGFGFSAPWTDPAGRASPRGVTKFTLELDGVLQKGYPYAVTWYADGYSNQLWFWVYNFPNGLPAGSHTFTGRWLAKCIGIGVHDPSCYEEIYTQTMYITFE